MAILYEIRLAKLWMIILIAIVLLIIYAVNYNKIGINTECLCYNEDGMHFHFMKNKHDEKYLRYKFVSLVKNNNNELTLLARPNHGYHQYSMCLICMENKGDLHYHTNNPERLEDVDTYFYCGKK